MVSNETKSGMLIDMSTQPKCVACKEPGKHDLTYANTDGVYWSGFYCDLHFRQKLRQWADVMYAKARQKER